MPLRIGYVREHFCSPLLQYEAEDKGKTFTLVECPSGTGQLISRLTNDEIDVAIALTDPLIAGIAKGSQAYKLVGSYVNSPLKWAVITGYNSPYNQISDLQGTTLGISRYGSWKSHNGIRWSTDQLKFGVNNDIRGLLDSVNDGSTSAFMWEWFTTKPFADAKESALFLRRGRPWLIAAHPERASPAELKIFLSSLTSYVREFQKPEARAGPSVEFIKKTFGYPEEDVKAWLQTVEYTLDCTQIHSEVLNRTLSVLEQAGAVTLQEGEKIASSEFVNRNVATLITPEEEKHSVTP
ncbi:hypothetical protein F5141DRAFT_1189085 [Pisolithus sp. B1]|nr:hypothetical protein F5141DRAFT_1189085 [Pisolithus sp. B1]